MKAVILFVSLTAIAAYGMSFSAAHQAAKRGDLRVLPLWFLDKGNMFVLFLYSSPLFTYGLFVSALVWGFLRLPCWGVLLLIPPAIITGAFLSHHRRPVFMVCVSGLVSFLGGIGVWFLPKT
jgi:hypothetical protein